MENYRDELYHHGVQGMKWGVWNEETRARRTGRRHERATQQFRKKLKKRMDKTEKIAKSDWKHNRDINSKSSAKKRGKQIQKLAEDMEKYASKMPSDKHTPETRAMADAYEARKKYNKTVAISAFLGGPVLALPITTMAQAKALPTIEKGRRYSDALATDQINAAYWIGAAKANEGM